ncbi:hypothetical protein DID88_010238 [Monilinia fructigena]|uniref:Uncharacterized protein n=1 Tax=Monilinia fructigena TaxID=38457 RepID=A0A395INE2_9HELO|nr:hypothetical protein DID88_010238 [Monilinia fructigena]
MGPKQTEPIRRNYSPHREHRPLNIISRESIPPEPEITREESVEIEKAQQLAKEAKDRDSLQISRVEDQ